MSGRLIHYSSKPLIDVRSTAHDERGGGAYKTPGLWVSVEGDHDWPAWCAAEQWGLDGFQCATEVLLQDKANVLRLKSASEIDAFTEEFSDGRKRYAEIMWALVREKYRGLIIAPYCWERRLHDRTSWYYSWDCASGVIWDASAVAELRPLPALDIRARIEAEAA